MIQESGEEDDSGPVPMGVGTALRAARQNMGMSLAEAAEQTRISSVYLQALEGSSAVERLPGPVYARFFLREYAEYLGLESEPLVKALGSFDVEPPQLQPLPGPRRWPKRIVAVASVGALVAIAAIRLALGGIGGVGAGGHALPIGPEAATTPRPWLTTQTRGGPHQPVIRGVRAVLAFSAPCWVQATVDGKVIINQTLDGGGSVELYARTNLELALGNAGGVRLWVNGSPVATGNSGEVILLRFAWRNGRLVIG